MGRAKALLPLGGKTFLERLIEVFGAELAAVTAVLGHHAEEIRRRLGSALAGANVVVNPDPDRGMLSSLQVGLRAMPADAEAAVFTLVDHPRLRVETLRSVIEAFERERPDVVIPRFKGRRGHPAMISRDVVLELLALPPEGSPQNAMRGRRDRTVFVDVDDPAVVEDIDDVEDYRRAIDVNPRPAGSNPESASTDAPRARATRDAP